MGKKALVVGSKDMAKFYQEEGFEVKFFDSPTITSEQLAKGIEELTRDATPKESIVFHYSGPGAQVPVEPSKKTRVIHMREVPPGWTSDLDFVYIGRPGRGMESSFGNRFKIGPDGDRAEVLRKFSEELDKKMAEDEEFAKSVRDLKGKTLVCFCRPLEGFKGRVLCHGQILASKATGMPPESFE